MRATERRQAILELLCERRYEKLENIAFEFGVSWLTVQRDIQELSLSYPIYTETGTFGGVYLEQGYVPGKQYLSSEQETVLNELMDKATDEQKKVLSQIINKYRRKPKDEVIGRY